jgi:hypothetical protein
LKPEIVKKNLQFQIMLGKSIYTRRLGSVVAKNAKRRLSGKFHVIASNTKRWTVVSEGSVRPIRAFTSKTQALTFAKRFAISKHGAEVIVHSIDGQVSDRVAV